MRTPSRRCASSGASREDLRQAAAGGRTYVYELTWSAPGLDGAFGACHGLDVPLVFGNLDRGQPAMLIGDATSPDVQSVSAQMLGAWASFAADGDPGHRPGDPVPGADARGDGPRSLHSTVRR